MKPIALLKKLFIILFVSTLTISCSKNEVDEPKPSNPIENPFPPDDGDGSSEELDELDPEPLTDEIRSIYTHDKLWVYEYVLLDYPYTRSQFTEKIYDDTLINGQHAVRIWPYGDNHEDLAFALNSEFEMFTVMREDNGCVYMMWSNEYSGHKYKQYMEFMYCYDVNPTEYSQHRSFNLFVHVISRGVIKLQGMLRRAALVWYGDYPDRPLKGYDFWVEGIGTLLGTESTHHKICTTWKNCYLQLLQCYDGDRLIYDANELDMSLYTELERFTDIDLQPTN